MASRNKATLCLESNFVETNKTLNLSPIINAIDAFSKGDTIKTTTFKLDDVKFIIHCYPKGTLPNSSVISADGREDTDQVAIFIKVLSSATQRLKQLKSGLLDKMPTGCPSHGLGQFIKCSVKKQAKLVMYCSKCNDAELASVALPPELKDDYHHANAYSNDDKRKVHVCITHDHQCLNLMETVGDLKCGMGFINIWTLSEVKNKLNPMIKINVKLFGDPLFISKEDMKMQTFLDQNEKMHQLSVLHGDVTLIVKLHQDNALNPLCVPLKKTRKLNRNKNSMDDDVGCAIKMNSSVVRAASKVFDRMLSANMIEKQQKTIEIHAKCVEDVKDLTYFMCTNKLKENSNALNLIELGHYYEMERLFWKCVYELTRNVTVEKFAQTLKLFDKYEIKQGYDTLVDFAKKNIEALKKTDDYDTISHAFKCLVFS